MCRKGTNGFGTNGVTANLMFFDTGTFWVLPLTYFYLPRSARAYLFPQSVEINYLCSGPISADPTCPQPIGLGMGRARVWHALGLLAVQAITCLLVMLFLVTSLLYIYIYIYIFPCFLICILLLLLLISLLLLLLLLLLVVVVVVLSS